MPGSAQAYALDDQHIFQPGKVYEVDGNTGELLGGWVGGGGMRCVGGRVGGWDLSRAHPPPHPPPTHTRRPPPPLHPPPASCRAGQHLAGASLPAERGPLHPLWALHQAPPAREGGRAGLRPRQRLLLRGAAPPRTPLPATQAHAPCDWRAPPPALSHTGTPPPPSLLSLPPHHPTALYFQLTQSLASSVTYKVTRTLLLLGAMRACNRERWGDREAQRMKGVAPSPLGGGNGVAARAAPPLTRVRPQAVHPIPPLGITARPCACG